MFETIFGWLGYTSTSKYMLALSQLDSLKSEIFWLKFANVSFQFILVAIAAWMVIKFWDHIKPSKKDKKKEENPEKKDGK